MKKEIREDPIRIFWDIFRVHPDLKIIEIELSNHNKDLLLMKDCFCRGKIDGNTLGELHSYAEGINYYDAKGRKYFKDLTPSFGGVRVFIGIDKPLSFDNYDDFLEKMT